MHPHDIERELRAFVRLKKCSLKKLTAEDALALATDHWLSTDVEGLRPERGDGLVADFEDKKAAEDLEEQIHASAPFHLVAAWSQHSAGVASEECMVPWGEPNHPTRAMSWAIA
jgi:hypothetical protein